MHDVAEVKPSVGELVAPRRPGGRLLLDAALPGGLALLGLGGTGLVLLVAQLAIRAPLLPGPSGLIALVAALSPSALALALPVAALIGMSAGSRIWVEGGEWLALSASGWGARRVAVPVLALGLGLGAGEAMLTHWLEPAGRAAAREILGRAPGELRVRPGQPSQVGDLLLLAEDQRGGELLGLFLARGDLVVAAARGRFSDGARLVLEDGSAKKIDAAGEGWSLQFGRAELAMGAPVRRLELVERGDAELRELISRMEAAGRGAAAERMSLAKRSVLPLTLPLLCLLGLPLGAWRARSGPAVVGVVLAWWALMRLCDQSVGVMGPLVAAGLPLGGLLLLTLIAWARWRAR